MQPVLKPHYNNYIPDWLTVAPQRIWKWGHWSGAKRRKKFFFWSCVVPLHFVALKAQLVVLVSAFVMVNTVSSVSCLLFFYSRCSPCPAICKSGGTCPPCIMESAPLLTDKMIVWFLYCVRCWSGARETAVRRWSYLPFRRRSMSNDTWLHRGTSSPNWETFCTAFHTTLPQSPIADPFQPPTAASLGHRRSHCGLISTFYVTSPHPS